MNSIPAFVNGDICKTVRASGHGSTDRHSWDMVADIRGGYMTTLRIRKLTPKECWRLQGFCPRSEDGSFDDECFEKAQAVCSKTQLYKQAGNSIVVNCIEEILINLFKKG